MCASLAACVGAYSPTTAVPVRHSGPTQFLLLPVEVNGIPTTFLFDTGTASTQVSREFADRIGLRDGQVDLHSFRVGSINAKRRIGEIQIADPPKSKCCARFDENVTGSLGSAMWSSLDYVLDARRPTLEIVPRLRLAASEGASPFRVSDRRMYLPVTIDGQTFDFLLDTGSSGARVTQKLIDQVKPVNYDYVQVEVTTGNNREYRNFPALHAAVELGDVRIPQFTFLVGEENVIGLNLLQYGELSVSTRESLFTFRGHE